MGMEYVDGSLDVSSAACVEYGSVFSLGMGTAAKLLGVENDVGCHRGVEDLGHGQRSSPTSPAVEGSMEGPVGFGRWLPRVVQGQLGLGQVDDGYPGNGTAQQLGFDRQPQRIVFLHLVGRKRADNHPSVAFKVHQASRAQSLEGLSDRDLAHTQLFGQLVLTEPSAWTYFASQHALQHLPLYFVNR